MNHPVLPSASVLTSPARSSQALTALRLFHRGVDTARRVPVTCGLDLPRGLLRRGEAIDLRSPGGAPVTLQTTPLHQWSDGSIQWLLLDFVADEVPAGWSEWSVRLNRDSLPLPDVTDVPALKITTRGLELRGAQLSADIDPVLTDHAERTHRPRFTQTEWESQGPVRWALRMEGRFDRVRGLRCMILLTVFPATGLVRMDLRLHNARRARHQGGLWDLGDAGSIRFRSFEAMIHPRQGCMNRMRWSLQSEADRDSPAGPLSIYQDSSGCANWQSANHCNAEGCVPCSFRGFEATTPNGVERGHHASPVLTLSSDESALSVVPVEFWQKFPSALETDGETIRAGLFPARWNDLFELQGGEQTTKTIWLYGSANEPLDVRWLHDPVRVLVPPEWHAETKALPYFCPAETDPHERLKNALAEAVQGPRSLLARREVIDEFGWRNFGDLWADHEQGDFKGQGPVISHYNNQFDGILGGLLQMARTGDPAWFDLFDPLARHVIDIDLYHTTEDRAAYNGGLFWHTDHYVAAGTATHRTYSRQNAKPGRSYGGGPSDEHNYTTGLLHYYWMTGSLDAKQAVRSLADWVIQVDDGSQTIFGLIDPGPTGLASATAFPDYHGPGRGAGNSINALLDGWQLTGEGKYLAKAEELIRRVVNPHDDIDSLDLLNVEARWSYTVCLSALAKYLSLKEEAGQCDESHQYAAACLRHYGRWMLAHEEPYFDHPEKLEYPTETWAAQELRKANVLRLAAKYAESSEAEAMHRRGDQLADRAWFDLERFETRNVARALVLVMTEGTRDCWLRRSAGEGQSLSPAPGDFPPAVAFQSQRDRIRRALRSPKGLLRLAVHALDLRNWPAFIRALRRQF